VQGNRRSCHPPENVGRALLRVPRGGALGTRSPLPHANISLLSSDRLTSIRRVLLVAFLAVAAAGCESFHGAESPHLTDACRALPPCTALLGPPVEAQSETLDRNGKKYAKRLVREIRRFWVVPEFARSGGEGRARVRFGIRADGSLACLELLAQRGPVDLSLAAMGAVCRAAPYQPLPESWVGSRPEGVTLSFYYNEEPPKGPKVLLTGPDGVTYGVGGFGDSTPQPSPTPTPAIPDLR
jgi:hypothetical protein